MKKSFLLFAALLGFAYASLFTGCSTTSVKDVFTVVNQILDANLDPTFNGPVHIDHKNPYFDFTIDATGLHRDDKGWHWQTLVYHRSDRWTSGNVTVGSIPSK